MVSTRLPMVSLIALSVGVAVACSLVLACDDPMIGIMSPDPGNGPVEGTVGITTWIDAEAEFVKVEFFQDGVLIGTDATEPFNLEWDTTEVSDGEYNIVAKGTRGDQTVEESDVVVVEVDNG